MSFRQIILDCTDLEAPEPMNLVIGNLSNCDDCTYIKMIHRIKPEPLLSILSSNSFESKVLQEDDNFIIYIWLANQKHLKEYIKSL